ncbi:unnamed protein product [Trichobilharzia szidati]|nr:unnamed protein product [Trichobilharzia szidati]
MDDKRGDISKETMKVKENDVLDNGEHEIQNLFERVQLFIQTSAVVNLLHKAIEMINSLRFVNQTIQPVKKEHKSTQTEDVTQEIISTAKSMREDEDETAEDFFSDYLRNRELYKALWKSTTQHKIASPSSDDRKMKDIEEVIGKSNFSGREITGVMQSSWSLKSNRGKAIEPYQSSSTRQLYWSQSTANKQEGGMVMHAVTRRMMWAEERQGNRETGIEVDSKTHFRVGSISSTPVRECTTFTPHSSMGTSNLLPPWNDFDPAIVCSIIYQSSNPSVTQSRSSANANQN